VFQQQKDKKDETYSIMVENVSKNFLLPHENRRTILENLTGILRDNRFEDFSGLKTIRFKGKKVESLGIIGENGSGKSTLLKILAGVLQPDTGTVKVDGKIAPFLELGVGFQPELTALENVRLYCSIMGMDQKKIYEKLDGIFEFAELERFREMKLKNFSSGMYARLAFATAFATEPDIYLIDEVLAVGDEAFQRKCMDKIDEIKSTNRTIVFVSHDMAAVKKLCKRAIFLEHGRIHFAGSTEKVIFSYHSYLNEKEIREFKKSIKKEPLPQELISEAIIPLKDNIPKVDNPVDEGLKDRWGTGEIEITDIKLRDKNNQEKSIFTSGDLMKIQIHYKINKYFENPAFGVGIYSNDGTYITGINTNLDEIALKLNEPEGVITLNFKDLPLLTGIYKITIVVCPGNRWETPYDIRSQKYSFKVQSAIKYDGFVQFPHTWEV